MKFKEYQDLALPLSTQRRRLTKRQLKSIIAFAEKQPDTCPVCGCQVFDPFGWGVVMHDTKHE